MKRISIIILIVFVIAIIVFYIFLEIRVPEITYVADYTNSNSSGSEYSVKRLYSSDINVEELEKSIGSLLQTEFMEEDYYASALKAGTPRFYPCFYYAVEKEYKDDGTFVYKLKVHTTQEILPEQPDSEFTCSNLKMEAVCSGLKITDAKVESVDGMGILRKNTPIIAEDGSSMAVPLNDAANYTIELTGNSGSVMLQHSFDIDTLTFFRRKYSDTQQLLIVNVNITNNGEGFISSFSKDDIVTIDDL